MSAWKACVVAIGNKEVYGTMTSRPWAGFPMVTPVSQDRSGPCVGREGAINGVDQKPETR